MRRLLGVLVVLSCVCAGSLVEPAAARTTQVRVGERCNVRLLPHDTVVLTSTLTLRSARGGRPALIRLLPGWSVGGLYPKGASPFVVEIAPGQTIVRTTSRRVVGAPRLWKLLRGGASLGCATTYRMSVPGSVSAGS